MKTSCIIIRSPNKIRLKTFSGKQKRKLVPFHLWPKQVIINNRIRNCKTVIFTIWALPNLVVNPSWPRAINLCIFSIWMKKNATYMTFWFIAIQKMIFTHPINDTLKLRHIRNRLFTQFFWHITCKIFKIQLYIVLETYW